ncbi:MAG: HsdR family type I site-specific deoxyribonuclease [Campylobacteraceae bacterium]|jgi:type I restriction enzyme R subunit|nr:HsdR family type I site-specific deoxyribonuclease [Campylobacteraceae bacterium]
MEFNKEAEFEKALINALATQYGWEPKVIKNPTEQELIDNWANILFNNNCNADRLNNCPLTNGEMQQIIEQIITLRTPLKLNAFINGKTVSIRRDNPDDAAHFGKEVSLKIYDRQEIAAGQSRYQIARQPKFRTHGILNDRRGDLMLLINGMPVIHIELKKSGISVTQAANQIEKYSREGVFSGLFALVQIFVAMEPNETLYFANPGMDGKFNPDFYFHWANFDNEPINDWKEIASALLSIPMAHQLIGFYTVPDDTDGILKVMRSYQYYAASAISDRVAQIKWEADNQRGGYIWHTTGSGKTMTSFKSAQLIANSKDADKVIFLMDRIELGAQSLKEYRGFAEDSDDIQATETTHVLTAKLKSSDPADTLIVTSIQKMSNIRADSGMNDADIKKMSGKRIVFIVDECHRSTFGEMLITVKNTFPNAIFFGFTGTPIHMENKIKGNTTADVFGGELHRYSIADGIRDKNVLGFDPYKVLTHKDKDIRKAVALHEAKAATEEEAIADPEKKKIYYYWINTASMAGRYDSAGTYVKGVEDLLPKSQYKRDEHKKQVAHDILENWTTLSHGGKFHALFATSSIPEAIAYYRLIKGKKPELKITALFDPNIDNGDGETTAFKEDGLVEIIDDYNARYGQRFDIGSHAKFKKDVAARLAHKEPYKRIENEPEKQIDLLIVVDQMLTGFDSKWINALYMDKLLEYQNIIQAFSRTNRLFGYEKPFGTIRYYRKPHTMEKNIEEAVKLYSGDKPIGLFVQRLKENLNAMNHLYGEIQKIFAEAGAPDFTKNPDDKTACGKFASLFREFNEYLEAAKIQGFKWKQQKYIFQEKSGARKTTITTAFNENDYLILAMRYKELFSIDNNTLGNGEDIPYDINGYLTEIDTGKINADYMNSRFAKYLKLINLDQKPSKELINQALDDLHKTFAALTQEEQKYAGIFLRDIERGDVTVEEGKTLRDYIAEYQAMAKADQIHSVAIAFGLNETNLRNMMDLKLTEENINEYGRFDKLKKTVDMKEAITFLEKQAGEKIATFKANTLIDDFLRKFLLKGGFDMDK